MLETEDDPPVGAYCDAPISCEVAPEWVQPEARQVEVVWASCCIQPGQHARDFVHVLRVYFTPVVVFVKAAQPAMSKASNHTQVYKVTIVTCQTQLAYNYRQVAGIPTFPGRERLKTWPRFCSSLAASAGLTQKNGSEHP